ncbi:hypothetical protein BN946_scf184753.g5 [Trametes cinnabarina]|uniref:Uncharacterized protein n=1 Tax=Pycnoporus cinnabarinus TaxID=5643 RepID=A0A060SSA5_PYCCI|nr:hypothetical protein BN946_scf184753.g5 [Trametes cinnabarina]
MRTTTPSPGSTLHAYSRLPEATAQDEQCPVYDKDRHSALQFWEKAAWESYMPRRHLHEFSLADGVPRYLEHLDGSTLEKKEYEDLRALLKMVFQELQDNGLAPDTWGRRNITALQFVHAQVYAHYPDLRECARHWKVNAICTRMYPDFKRDRSNTRTTKTTSHPAKREYKVDINDLEKEPFKRPKLSLAEARPTTRVQSPTPVPEVPHAFQAPIPRFPDLTSALQMMPSTVVSLSQAPPTPLQSAPSIQSSDNGLPLLYPIHQPPSIEQPFLQPESFPVTPSQPANTDSESPANATPCRSTLQQTAIPPLVSPDSLSSIHSHVLAPTGTPGTETSHDKEGRDSDVTEGDGIVPSSSAQTDIPSVVPTLSIPDPLGAFRSSDGPALPNLLAHVTKPRPTTAGTNVTSKSSLQSRPDTELDTSSTVKGKTASTKKPGKMRLTKSKTARNLYAHVYIKEHGAMSASEFDEIFKALEPDIIEEFNAMHIFAQEHGDLDGPEDIIRAFRLLLPSERETYIGRVKADKKGKGKARA